MLGSFWMEFRCAVMGVVEMYVSLVSYSCCEVKFLEVRIS